METATSIQLINKLTVSQILKEMSMVKKRKSYTVNVILCQRPNRIREYNCLPKQEIFQLMLAISSQKKKQNKTNIIRGLPLKAGT